MTSSLRRENALLLAQARILEMMATAAPLPEIMAQLSGFIEAHEEGLACGILIVAEDGKRFSHSYGPHVPAAYHRAVLEAALAPPYPGPCGQAVHEGIEIEVADIASDARWPIWRELSLACGFRNCRSIPVLSASGRVLASLAIYGRRAAQPARLKLIGIATHLTSLALEHRRTAAALRVSEKAHDLLKALPVALYTTDTAGRILFFNEAAATLWGRRPALGEELWCGSWLLHWPDGSAMPHDQCPMAITLKEGRATSGEACAERPDGSRVPFLAYPSPLYDEAGNLTGAVNMLVDITDRKRAEEQRMLLVNELNHRVKNALSTVQSMAAQTFRSDIPVPALSAFEARLLALSTTHNALTQNNWRDASLRQLVEQELIPHRGPQLQHCSIEGSDFRLMPQLALALGMAFHELATNASRYGALSCPTGRVAIAWKLQRGEADIEARLHLTWTETGGPQVAVPDHRGFGMRLIQRGLARELNGDVQIDFRPAGLVCSIDIPWLSDTARSATLPQRVLAGSDA